MPSASIRRLVLRSRRGEVDLRRRGVVARRDGRASSSISRPAASIRARDLPVRPSVPAAATPPRAAPSSPANPAAWPAPREILRAVRETRCSSLHLERALWVDRVDLHHLRGDVFEKVPVVGDHQAGVDGPDRTLEPQDAFQVQVIGRLVQKQHVRRGYQRSRDSEALPPSAGECRAAGVAGVSKPARPSIISLRAVFSCSSSGRPSNAAVRTELTVSSGPNSESWGT